MVALVVTVVVLLILAGITIMYVMGDNGIFGKAQDAKDKTERAKEEEKSYLENLGNDIEDYASGNVPRVPIADIINKKVDKNTPAKDSLGNPITIPGGFKVVPDGEDDVEYTYTGDKKPTVQDGIVIEDDEGNQFVWIPVGDIKNKKDDTKGATTTIQLARYTFNTGSSGDGSIKEKKEAGSLIVTIGSAPYGFLEEDTDSITTYKNTKAKNIGEFVSKTKSNGGYYLARYEASYKDDTHCYSKVSTGTPRTDSSTALTSGMLWNFITQPDAATVARNSFSNSNVESDLVNSCSWDTAIVFIQTYSGDNDYSKEVGYTFSSSLVNTGTNGDKRCNIYDMASNNNEWTTETSTYPDYPCVAQGGNYTRYNNHTTCRSVFSISYNSKMSFRSLLYIGG